MPKNLRKVVWVVFERERRFGSKQDFRSGLSEKEFEAELESASLDWEEEILKFMGYLNGLTTEFECTHKSWMKIIFRYHRTERNGRATRFKFTHKSSITFQIELSLMD